MQPIKALDRRWKERILCIVGALPIMVAGYWLLAWYAARALPNDVSTALDRAIPLWPPAVWLYVAYYPYPLPLFWLTPTIGDFRRAVACIVGQSTVAWVVFLGFPVVIPRPAFDPAGPNEWLLWHVHHTLDPNPGNCLPSLHVAISISGALLYREHAPRWWWPALILGVAISLSTVLVKQHFVWDVPTGAALGVAGWWFFYRVKAVRELEFFRAV